MSEPLRASCEWLAETGALCVATVALLWIMTKPRGFQRLPRQKWRAKQQRLLAVQLAQQRRVILGQP